MRRVRHARLARLDSPTLPTRPSTRSVARSRLAGAVVVAGLVVSMAAVPTASAASRTETRSPAVAVIPGAAVAAIPAAATRPVLRRGDRGPAVKEVQSLLKVRPLSGFFGPRTLAAVRAFQRRAGLRVTGVVERTTWAALLRKRPSRSMPSTNGLACPAPGATFGDGWGSPRGGHRHQGVDLMGTRGMPILAIESGFIVREGRQRNGALRIVMQGRSGSKYYYGHNSSHLVSAGQRVSAGQQIATMGDTGSPGAVHLHFEYWRSGGESAAVPAEPLIKRVCGIGPG